MSLEKLLTDEGYTNLRHIDGVGWYNSMNYKLIMLPQPILVSDEAITKEDKCISLTTFRIYTAGLTPETKWETEKKIIAGIEGLPKLDLSLIADEIGWVDVEKLVSLLNTPEELDQHSFDSGFIQGFKAAQSLNEKKFSLEDLENAYYNGWIDRNEGISFPIARNRYINELSKPKEYLVEAQTERTRYPKGDDGWEDVYTPKITNNTIKILKLC